MVIEDIEQSVPIEQNIPLKEDRKKTGQPSNLETDLTGEDKSSLSSPLDGLSRKELTKIYRQLKLQILEYEEEFKREHGQNPDPNGYDPIQEQRRKYQLVKHKLKERKSEHEGKVESQRVSSATMSNPLEVSEGKIHRNDGHQPDMPRKLPTSPGRIVIPSRVSPDHGDWIASVDPDLLAQLNSNERSQLDRLIHFMKKCDSEFRETHASQGTPEDLTFMTKHQLKVEKQIVQRALLSLEKSLGRPRTLVEKEITRPLYNRYRMVKQVLMDWEQSGIQDFPSMTASQMAEERQRQMRKHQDNEIEQASPRELADSGIQVDQRPSINTVARIMYRARLLHCRAVCLGRLCRTIQQMRHRPRAFCSSTAVDLLDFEREEVFSSRTDAEVARAFLVLQLCSIDVFVDHSLQLMTFGQNLLPRKWFEYIMKKSFYGQLIPGSNHAEVISLARQLATVGIRCMPAPSIEDELDETGKSSNNTVSDFEETLDVNAEQVLGTIELTEKLFNEDQQSCIMAFKLSAIFRPQLLKLLSSGIMSTGKFPEMSPYTFHEQMQETADKSGCLDEYDNGMRRLSLLSEKLDSGNLSAFIDAEYSYMQPAIRGLVLFLQLKYNKNRPVIFNTQQAYLKTSEEDNKVNLAIADKSGFLYGTKVVRGAYMDKERSLAEKLGYQDPIYSSYEETSSSYDKILDVLLQRSAVGQGRVMAATHNEQSVKFGVKRYFMQLHIYYSTFNQ
jgi:hydroxyproline oxidase